MPIPVREFLFIAFMAPGISITPSGVSYRRTRKPLTGFVHHAIRVVLKTGIPYGKVVRHLIE